MAGDAFKDYKPQSVAGLSARQLKALTKWGPQTAQTLQDINANIAPQEQALNLKLLQQYAPEYTQVGSDIATQEAQNQLALTQGPGKALAEQAIALDKSTNPEFYASREAAGKGFLDLISGQDPNKLSGAEMAQTERNVNRLNARTGNLNTGDATTTVANASLFGDELGKKRDRFGQALALFPGISAGSRSPIDTFGIASGKQSTPNFGNQQYQTQNGQSATSGMLDRIAGTQQNQQNILAGRRNIQDYSEGAVGSVCCFIMIAANDEFELPYWIRKCRDYFYKQEPQVAVGYKKMAKWLVPLMNRSSLLRKFIKFSMYYPLSYYGKYLVGESKYGFVCKPIKSFWFNIWRNI